MFPVRDIHVAGDAAYHGTPLLIAGTTITTRLPANAALYAPAPPRTGRRGRPRLTGHRLGRPAELAADGDWQTVKVSRYGRIDTVELAQTPSIWYGAFGNNEGRTLLVREPGHDKVLAIFTIDTDSSAADIVARYAHRWPIETAVARRQATPRRRPGPQPAAARSNAPCRFSSSPTARLSGLLMR